MPTLLGPTLLPNVEPRVTGATGGRRPAAATPTLGLVAAVDEALPLAVLVPLIGRLVEAARELVGPGRGTAEPRVPLVFRLVGTNPPVLPGTLGGFMVDRAMGLETARLAAGIAGDDGVLRLLTLSPEVNGRSDDLAAGEEARRGNLVDGACSCSVSVWSELWMDVELA